MAIPDVVGVTSEQDEEGLLIARAQGSDRAAWDEIFQRNYQRIFVFVYCRVGDNGAAEDLTAEVFLEAWRGIKRFHYRGVPLISWLYKIAHNLLADFIRKRQRTRTQPLDEEKMGASRDHAEQVAVWQSVAAALRKLTLDQQQVILSRFLEGLSIGETAALLGKNENAIKQLEFRALRSVRKILAGPALRTVEVR